MVSPVCAGEGWRANLALLDRIAHGPPFLCGLACGAPLNLQNLAPVLEKLLAAGCVEHVSL
jgi:hypothetical protein